jgi:hypothetical protein
MIPDRGSEIDGKSITIGLQIVFLTVLPTSRQTDTLLEQTLNKILFTFHPVWQMIYILFAIFTFSL